MDTSSIVCLGSMNACSARPNGSLKPSFVAMLMALGVIVFGWGLSLLEYIGPFHGASEVNRGIWAPAFHAAMTIDLFGHSHFRGQIPFVIALPALVVFNWAFWFVVARLGLAGARWVSPIPAKAGVTQRQFLVLVAGIIVGVSMLLAVATYDRVRWVNYLRIDSGMTAWQVRGILGWNSGWHPADGAVRYEGKRAEITIKYAGGQVVDVSYMSR